MTTAERGVVEGEENAICRVSCEGSADARVARVAARRGTDRSIDVEERPRGVGAEVQYPSLSVSAIERERGGSPLYRNKK